MTAAANTGPLAGLKVLDLKTPEAQEIVRKLVLESDVLIENFRPGAMQGQPPRGAARTRQCRAWGPMS